MRPRSVAIAVLESSPSSSLPSSSSSTSTTKRPSIALLGPQKFGTAFLIRHFGLLFLVVRRWRGCTVGIGVAVAVAIAAFVVSAATTSSSSLLL
jgi:hypothetical protein